MATTKTHRAANFAQAAVYTLIVIAILGVLNFLAQRYNKSFDSTANKKYTLSDQTAKIVKNIQGDLIITYWDRPSGFTNARGSVRSLQGTFAESHGGVSGRRQEAHRGDRGRREEPAADHLRQGRQ